MTGLEQTAKQAKTDTLIVLREWIDDAREDAVNSACWQSLNGVEDNNKRIPEFFRALAEGKAIRHFLTLDHNNGADCMSDATHTYKAWVEKAIAQMSPATIKWLALIATYEKWGLFDKSTGSKYINFNRCIDLKLLGIEPTPTRFETPYSFFELVAA